MNLAATLELYCGGPGSGCDPDAARKAGNKCGRPAEGESRRGTTDLERLAKQFDPKEGGHFNLDTEVSQLNQMPESIGWMRGDGRVVVGLPGSTTHGELFTELFPDTVFAPPETDEEDLHEREQQSSINRGGIRWVSIMPIAGPNKEFGSTQIQFGRRTPETLRRVIALVENLPVVKLEIEWNTDLESAFPSRYYKGTEKEVLRRLRRDLQQVIS